MANSLSVNTLQNTSGTQYGFYAGQIIQCVAHQYSDVYHDVRQGQEIELPGVLGNGAASITPLNSSSRILFVLNYGGGQEDTWRHQKIRSYYKIGAGSWTEFTGGSMHWMSWGSSANGAAHTNGIEHLLPSLSTTSAVSFKCTWTGNNNGGYIHLNQNNRNNDTSDNNLARIVSAINLYEIYQ